MTYRQWVKKMNDRRIAAVPDIRDQLPLSTVAPTILPQRSTLFCRVVAGVAAAAVLVVLVGYIGWGNLFGGQQLGTPLISTPGDMPFGTSVIPLHTTIKAETMLYSKMPPELIDSVNDYVGARVLQIMEGKTPPEHISCHGVYYNMEKASYFCATHAVASALEKIGKPTNGLLVHYYHPVYNRIVFTCADSARSSYVYDIAGDILHRLPVSLYHCPLLMSELLSEHPYVLLHKMGGGRDDIYVVNLLTAELFYVLKNSKGNYIYNPMDDSRITTDGKYVYYTLMEGDGQTVNGPARTTVVYDVTTGKSRTFIGEVWNEVAGTTHLLIKDPDGFAVYDAASGEKVRYTEAGLPKYYDYYTKRTDVYTEFDYRLLICNRVTGEETLLCEEYIVASASVGQYLYYYVRGEDGLRVRNMTSGTEEYLPLETGLALETESDENKNRFLRFELWPDENYGELWLYYAVTDATREDAEAIRHKQENYPGTHLDRLIQEGKLTSILSLESILRRFPNGVTAYEGDGFLYLDYTGLTADESGIGSSNLQIAYEDYKSGIFYYISHQNGNAGSSFSFWERGKLTVDAEQKTRDLLKELNIPVNPAARDYRTHLSEDPRMKMQAKLSEFSGERVRAYRFIYCVQKPSGYIGVRMYLEDAAELQELYDFIDFTDTLTYEKELNYYSEEYQQYYKYHTYSLHCKCWDIDTYEIYLGRLNGKPFLMKRDCLAALTEEQYTKWTAWMDQQEKKCHVD